MATAEEDDIAARFAAIVSPMASTMNWETDHDETTDTTAVETAAEAAAQAARDREARREQRRRERARDLADFNAEKAELESAYNSDDDHFTPPEPPPLPRLRPATVGAVVLIAVGIALIAAPTLLVIDTQLTMILGLLLLAAGAGTLVSRLRGHDDDPNGPNGAVL